jgi:Immunity protein 49
MKIQRHPVDLEHMRTLFRENSEYLGPRLERARQSSHPLSGVIITAGFVYRAGVVLSPDSREAASALCLEAQANTAMLVFGRIEDPPRYCPLGEGPPVTYSEPADESHVHVGRWTDAWYQAAVTRQANLLSMLRDVPTDLLRRSSTRGSDFAYRHVDFIKETWLDARFIHHPVFTELEEISAACLDNTDRCQYVRHLTAPFLEVLRQIEKGDERQLDAALTEASQMHKKYWSATKKRRQELEGLVSLKLTAAAALAWDRGMRFDVESDYIPKSWVTGELFTMAAK